MHIPENYLAPASCAVMTAAMVPVWIHSVKKVKKEIPKEKIPLMGVAAALSFLGMMFNVPLIGGTTGHAVGGTLIALLFGPEAACIAVSIALLLQAVMFGDGGILAYGANCFNMAFILPFAGYGIYRTIVRIVSKSGIYKSSNYKNKSDLQQISNYENKEVLNKNYNSISKADTGKNCESNELLKENSSKESKQNTDRNKIQYIAAAIGSYLGINLAAFFTAIEFGLQPMIFKDSLGNALYCPYDFTISVPAMMIPHLAIAGVVEAIFTVAVYMFVKKTSPDLVYEKIREQDEDAEFCYRSCNVAVEANHEIKYAAAEFDHKPSNVTEEAWQGQKMKYKADESAYKPKNAFTETEQKSKHFPIYLLVVVLILATPLGLLATGTAWGEWGTDEIAKTSETGSALGYTPKGLAEGWSLDVIAPDYSMGGVNEIIAYILSALIGTAILIIIFKLLSIPLGARKRNSLRK